MHDFATEISKIFRGHCLRTPMLWRGNGAPPQNLPPSALRASRASIVRPGMEKWKLYNPNETLKLATETRHWLCREYYRPSQNVETKTTTCVQSCHHPDYHLSLMCRSFFMWKTVWFCYTWHDALFTWICCCVDCMEKLVWNDLLCCLLDYSLHLMNGNLHGKLTCSK